MKITVSEKTRATPEKGWETVTNIKEAAELISAIERIEVLEEPESGLLGFKWRETRVLFGKSAQETMTIADVDEGKSYVTHAASHGSVYTTRVSVIPTEEGCALEYEFSGEAQSFMAKVLSFVFTPLMKGAMIKALRKDLLELKSHIES